MATIKDTTRQLADLIVPQLKLEGTEIKYAEGDRAGYHSTLPVDAINKAFEEKGAMGAADAVHAHDEVYGFGYPLAITEFGVQALKDNPDLKHVTASSKVGIANIDVIVNRDGVKRIPAKEKGGEQTVTPVKGKIAIALSATSDAEIKRIKQHAMNLGAQFLADAE